MASSRTPRTEKVYMYFGIAVWGFLRYLFFAVTYILVFIMGGKEGSFTERWAQVKLPRINVTLPWNKPLVSKRDLVIDYYTVLVGTHGKQAAASAQNNQLLNRRINRHVVLQNGKYYVVVGRYNSSQQANSQLQRVVERGFSQAIVAGPDG